MVCNSSTTHVTINNTYAEYLFWNKTDIDTWIESAKLQYAAPNFADISGPELLSLSKLEEGCSWLYDRSVDQHLQKLRTAQVPCK